MNGIVNKIRKRTIRLVLFAAVTSLAFGLVVACGGGGSGGGTTAPRTLGVSAGEIEGLGSIFVNGVRFDTSSAQVEIEGIENPTDDDLQPGMIVEVEGNFNDDDGTATLVRAEDALEGPIATITSSSALVKTLSIMGQTVIVEDGVTQFDNTAGAVTFGTLAENEVVEVSGHPDDSGAIVATRIERKAADLATFIASGNLLEIKGQATNVTATTFNIGTLTVDFTGITPRNGTLTEGILVEVKGNDLVGTTLTATDVEVRIAGLGLANEAKVHIEGFVANLTTSTFTLDGQMVNFSNAVFRGGIADDLVAGVRVEAEGPIDAAGVLQAVKVTFKESVRFEGNIDNPIINNTFALEGLPGITITVDTTITEGAGQLAAALAGNEIKVRARATGSGGGTLMATRFELIDPQSSDRLIIQAPVTSVSNPTITLLGSIVVDTNQIVDRSFDDSTGTESSNFEIEDREVTRAEFFSLLQVGDIVKARARMDQAGTMTWDQVEIEIED